MKIYITWPGWSGKSTLARKLSLLYNMPLVNLDNLLWKDGWIENENYWALQSEEVKKPDWIIEWPSCSIIKIMRNNVDLIILLNTPAIWNVFRILKRSIKEFFLWEKREWLMLNKANKIDLSFILRTLKYKKRQLPRILKNIEDYWLKSNFIEINSLKDSFEKIEKIIKQKNLI